MTDRLIIPKFRPDIVRHSYTDSLDADIVILEDPVANRYFRISTYEYELLRSFDGKRTLAEVIERLKFKGRHITPTHAKQLVEQFGRSGLLLGTGYTSSKAQTALRNRMELEERKRRPFKLYYLYLPLFNPDRFLSRTLFLWRAVVNRFTTIAFLCLIPGAAYLAVHGFDRLMHETLSFLNFKGLLYLWAAIFLMKLAHEFSHAYTAKSYGLRVPEMGLALLIFFPCLYCNTTAAWELADPRKRMRISAAGVTAEFVTAVIALYVWYFTQPGVINYTARYLALISLLSSLLFNGNPLLKLDGYFVLSDLIKIPNLQTRAYGYLRYLFFNRVLGIETVVGPRGSDKQKLIYASYGSLALAYRIFLYCAIIGSVYYRFDKFIGMLLGVGAFLIMLVRPLVAGALGLSARRKEMHLRPVGTAVFGFMVIAVIALLVTPWSEKSVYPCRLESARTQEIAYPAEGPVREVNVRQGSRVLEGATILRLDPVYLNQLLMENKLQRAQLELEISMIETSGKDLALIPLKYVELGKLKASEDKFREDLGRLEWKAPFSGAVVKWARDVQNGARVEKGAIVGELADERLCSVFALIPESDIAFISPGQELTVIFPQYSRKKYPLRVTEIGPYKWDDLTGTAFSSRAGGDILVDDSTDAQRPIEPHYYCKAEFENTDALPLGLTGVVVFNRPPKSLLTSAKEVAFRTFRREILF